MRSARGECEYPGPQYSWQGGGSNNNDTVRTVTNNLDTGRTQTYTYDSTNRLATAQTQATSGSNCWGLSYGYDQYSNRLTATVNKCSAPSLNLTVNTQNRITNSGFTYDAAGNMTADGTLTYDWDGESRLASAAGVTYTYDGDGTRVKKSNGALYWSSIEGNLLEQTNSTGGSPADYIYFNGRRVARREVLSAYYLAHDLLGSLRAISTGSGTILRTLDYYPWGGAFLNSGTTDDPHRFAQLYFDSESGLYHTMNRKYSDSLGRWLSPDADPGSISNPQSLNLYTYVIDNPTNLTDPRGLAPSGPTCSGCAPAISADSRNTFPEPEGGEVCPGAQSPGGTRGSIPGEAPGFSTRIGRNSFSYFRVCICDQLIPVPVGFPRRRQQACAMTCKCDDGAFGIGLYNVKKLQEVCGEAADVICPVQIKTISAATRIGPFQPVLITLSQIIACRLIYSRPLE